MWICDVGEKVHLIEPGRDTFKFLWTWEEPQSVCVPDTGTLVTLVLMWPWVSGKTYITQNGGVHLCSVKLGQPGRHGVLVPSFFSCCFIEALGAGEKGEVSMVLCSLRAPICIGQPALLKGYWLCCGSWAMDHRSYHPWQKQTFIFTHI